jgi:hypothetical protein
VDNLGALANIASPAQGISINMLSRGMDAQASEVAQLLQGMPSPPAPMPSHLGQSVNLLA